MQPGPPRRRRARPVADAPVDALLLRAEDLTKGWLLALLEQAPLDDAPSILAADLARDGPRMCDSVVRALANDDDLRRLEPGGALELLASQAGEIAGAQSTEAIARAIDALHAVIWAGIREELPRPDPEQISELAERLGSVIELVRRAALRRHEGGPGGAEGRGSGRMGPLGIALQRAHGSDQPPAEGLEGATGVVAAVVAEPAHDPSSGPVHPPADALWVGAVEDEIRRAERSGSALSLLLVELEDADRVMAVEPPTEATATFGRFAQAVRTAMRRQDILACETESRAWIIARDTGRLGAQAIGSRVAAAVRSAAPWRGAPMAVSVGVAVLGDDGRDSASLIELAEESKYAAAASGIAVVRTPAPAPDDPEPSS